MAGNTTLPVAKSISATPGWTWPGKPRPALLQPNGEVVVEPRMDVQHVADAVLFMASLPLDANVQFITVMATNMPFIGRG